MNSNKIFEKYTLNNGVEIKNRLVVTPMTLFVANEDGTFSEEDLKFMSKRGENIGMFIVEATLVADGGKAFTRQPEAINETHLPSLRKVAEILRNQGTKAILQIHHGGRLALPNVNKNDIIAPSYDNETKAREITTDEIDKLIQAFGNAADLAIQLEPLLGKYAKYCLSLGIFAAGLSSAIATPLGASYTLAGLFGWKYDNSDNRFKITNIMIVLMGILGSGTGFNPISLILFSQFLNGIILPVVVIYLVYSTSQKKLLGEYRNNKIQSTIGWIVAIISLILGGSSLISAMKNITSIFS